MKFEDVVRLLSIGASHTGKTTLIATMILRGCFGNFMTKDYIIYVLSPSEESLNQAVWTMLNNKGFKIVRIVLDNDCIPELKKITKPSSEYKSRIMVVDDLAKSKCRGVIDFIGNMYAVDSHHTKMHMILLSHQLTNGIPQSRSSAGYIIVHNNSPKSIKTIAIECGADHHVLSHALSRPAGLIPASHDSRVCDNYNYVIVLRKNYKFADGTDVPLYYKLSDVEHDKSELIPLDTWFF